MSHALRHAPKRYGLTLDEQGGVRLTTLVAALQRLGGEWRGGVPDVLVVEALAAHRTGIASTSVATSWLTEEVPVTCIERLGV